MTSYSIKESGDITCEDMGDGTFVFEAPVGSNGNAVVTYDIPFDPTTASRAAMAVRLDSLDHGELLGGLYFRIGFKGTTSYMWYQSRSYSGVTNRQTFEKRVDPTTQTTNASASVGDIVGLICNNSNGSMYVNGAHEADTGFMLSPIGSDTLKPMIQLYVDGLEPTEPFTYQVTVLDAYVGTNGVTHDVSHATRHSHDVSLDTRFTHGVSIQ